MSMSWGRRDRGRAALPGHPRLSTETTLCFEFLVRLNTRHPERGGYVHYTCTLVHYTCTLVQYVYTLVHYVHYA